MGNEPKDIIGIVKEMDNLYRISKEKNGHMPVSEEKAAFLCSCIEHFPAIALALEIAVEALEELSCLGNGDRPGNSIGNKKAQNALARIKSLPTS